MRLAQNTLLNSGGQKDLYVPGVAMVKHGILQIENFSTARVVAFKQVWQRELFSLTYSDVVLTIKPELSG